jgi:transcriptional regulator with GAF, ATPase, and Fis domain
VGGRELLNVPIDKFMADGMSREEAWRAEARLRDEIRREAKILVNWMVDEGLGLRECEDVVRREVIEAALYVADGCISHAAIALGYHRNMVSIEMKRLGIRQWDARQKRRARLSSKSSSVSLAR